MTSFRSYDGAGRPLTIIDPNGVTTSLTYNRRGLLKSQTIGTLKTSYAYDKALNLVQVTQPDGYTYDQAHRLTGIADAVGDHIAYIRSTRRAIESRSRRSTRPTLSSKRVLIPITPSTG